MNMVVELSEINIQITLLLVSKLLLSLPEDFQRTDSCGLELFLVDLSCTVTELALGFIFFFYWKTKVVVLNLIEHVCLQIQHDIYK
jgi:hypothetical protein